LSYFLKIFKDNACLIGLMKNPYKTTVSYGVDEMLKIAFQKSAEAVKKARFAEEAGIVERARQKEGIRIKISADTLHKLLKGSAHSFEDPRRLPKIYHELVKLATGDKDLGEAVHAIVWSANRIKELQMAYLDKLEKDRHTQDFRTTRKEAYGRMTSFVKHAKKYIELLHEASSKLRQLPDFEDVPTIIIAGLPNVGKTSLLERLTDSKPRIESYPFTTKQLMLGYTEYGAKRVQFIDTPGLLDRPIHERNKIEMHSIAVMKELGNVIIYVFDLSETCGYTVERQLHLYEEIKKVFDKPIIPVANKVDAVGGRPLSDVQDKVDEKIIAVSCTEKTGFDVLNKFIKDCIKYI